MSSRYSLEDQTSWLASHWPRYDSGRQTISKIAKILQLKYLKKLVSPRRQPKPVSERYEMLQPKIANLLPLKVQAISLIRSPYSASTPRTPQKRKFTINVNTASSTAVCDGLSNYVKYQVTANVEKWDIFHENKSELDSYREKLSIESSKR